MITWTWHKAVWSHMESSLPEATWKKLFTWRHIEEAVYLHGRSCLPGATWKKLFLPGATWKKLFTWRHVDEAAWCHGWSSLPGDSWKKLFTWRHGLSRTRQLTQSHMDEEAYLGSHVAWSHMKEAVYLAPWEWKQPTRGLVGDFFLLRALNGLSSLPGARGRSCLPGGMLMKQITWSHGKKLFTWRQMDEAAYLIAQGRSGSPKALYMTHLTWGATW